MFVQLSYAPNRYAPLQYRSMQRNLYWMGVVSYEGRQGALAFNGASGQYEMHCKGSTALVLPTDDIAYMVNVENAKLGAKRVGPDWLPNVGPDYVPHSTPVTDTAPRSVGGRPRQGDPMTQIGISLTAAQVDYCRALSRAGSVGEGVRACIDAARLL